VDSTLVLTVSAASLAVLHTLIPDHELPLAMIGRAQNWTIRKMAGITVIAGLIHISVSMAIGVIALAVSTVLAQQVALTAHRISGILLIAFGLIYSILGWRGEHGHGHSHEHPHNHLPSESEIELGSKREPTASRGAWLVAIVGIAPCFTLIPVLIDAMWFGTATVLWVMFVYAIERHIEILAGLVILAVGLWVVLPDIFFPAHTHP